MALETQQQKRNTAYKVWIGDLLKSNISVNDNRLNYIELGNKKIVRVNVIANIIDRYQHSEKPYTSVTLDDSSGQIKAKAFDNLTDIASFNVGDSIRIIGTIRYFNQELYIQPEIIKKVDDKWLLVRKLELGNKMNEPEKNSLVVKDTDATYEMSMESNPYTNLSNETKEIKIEEEKIEDNAKEINIKDALFSKISENSDGIDIDTLIMAIKYPVSEINSNVTELIEEGKIYEPQPGKLRSI